MVVSSPFVLFLCTLWALCSFILIYFLLFTDQKKKKHVHKAPNNCLVHHFEIVKEFSISFKIIINEILSMPSSFLPHKSHMPTKKNIIAQGGITR